MSKSRNTETVKTIDCPQCGNKLVPDATFKVQCLMCGWGVPEGVDMRTFRSGPLGYLANKSRTWRAVAIAGTIAAVLVVPSGLMFPINQIRAESALKKAREQMDKRLYASAARTLHQTPRNLVPANKVNEVRSLLSDNVRWAQDTVDIKTAKTAIAEDDPLAALDELSDLEIDFPLGDEMTDLVDLAQDQILDDELEISEDLLDEVAFLPDDPELGNIGEIAVSEDLADIAVDGVDTEADLAEAVSEPEIPATGEDDLLELEEFGEGADLADLEFGWTEDPVDEASVSPVSTKRANKVNLYHLVKPGKSNHFYTIDKANEVDKLRDKKSGTSGYQNMGVIGKLADKKVKKLKKQVVPLYRYYSQKRTDHFYTINPNFAANNSNANYKKQLVAGYIGRWSVKKNKCVAGKLPLYVVRNKANKANFMTTNVQRKNDLITDKVTYRTNKKGKKVKNVEKASHRFIGIAGCLWP